MENSALLKLENVCKTFEIRTGITKKRQGEIRAVEDVNFEIKRGETFGLIGETGSGKTTIAKMILLLHKPDAGKIFFDGRDIFSFSKREVSEYRKRVQTVFQDPTSSLNPSHDVKSILGAPLSVHHEKSKDRIFELLRLVNLDDSYAHRYPYTLSGGEKQRVAIARALALNPALMLLDEPTSALDVSVQAKIIDLLRAFKEKLNMTYLFISHDLSLVANFCDRTLVMYNGHMCEMGSTEEIFKNPLHPYTELLLSSVPVISESEEMLKPKEVPTDLNQAGSRALNKGCVFANRCWLKQTICETTTPAFKESSHNHWVACHFR